MGGIDARGRTGEVGPPFPGPGDAGVPPLVLASASPRRAQILRRLGLEFTVDPPDLPEEVRNGETPEGHAERLSREKALQVSGRHPEALVVAGDTVVVLGDRILGKPRDPGEAEEMLLTLSGRRHSVVSGLALSFPGGRVLSGVSVTAVTFRTISREMARAYVATEEPMDKAGSYGIQGLGAALVREVQGDYHTVVGLPLPLLLDLLELGGWRYEFGCLAPKGPSSP